MLSLEKCFAEVRIPGSLLGRISYIIWCISISAYSLGSFAKLVQAYLAVHYDYMAEAVMVTGQVGFQSLFMTRFGWNDRVRYLFVALTVSMVGSLMLLPLLIVSYFGTLSALCATIYFFVVVGIIFIIHHQLIVTNSLPTALSFTWVLYRLLLLLFVTVPR